MHWLMAALMLLAILSILVRGWLPSGDALRPVLRQTHLIAGQLVLALVPLRLWVRHRFGVPSAPDVSGLAARAGWAVHALLYLLMLVQPLIGILFMQAGGKEVGLLGWHLPHLVAPDTEVHFMLKDTHLVIANVAYALVSMHIGAALMHHFVFKNSTLKRMLPWRAPSL